MPAKRSDINATQSHVEDNLKGKLKTIHCINFSTFDDIIFRPVTSLNLILGPNGTGKSSGLAAIILGLGGDPGLITSEKLQLSDYVKNGRDKATIKIQLYKNDEGDLMEFRRDITKTGNTFAIDDKIVTRKQFIAIVETFNIKLSNLCQILPQHRLSDFAKMNPQELFKSTIESVCNKETIEEFHKLRDLRKEQLENEDKHVKAKTKYDNLGLQIESLKPEIEQMQQLVRMKDNLKLAEAKLLWLVLPTIDEELKILTIDERKKWADYLNFKKLLEKVKKKQETWLSKVKAFQDELNMYENDMGKILIDKRNIQQTIQTDKMTINFDKSNLKAKVKEQGEQYSELLKKISLHQMNTAALAENERELIEKFGEVAQRKATKEEQNNKIEKLNAELMRAKSQWYAKNMAYREKERETEELTIELKKYQDVAIQKLDEIKKYRPGVWQAMEWMDANRDKFKGTVYKPLILEVSLLNASCGAYLENLVPARDLYMFICEDKDDMKLILRELVQVLGVPTNTAHSKPAKRCTYEPPFPIAELRPFGIVGWLLDVVKAPPSIVNFLCSLYKLHKIPYGNDNVSRMTDQIANKGIGVFYGGQSRFQSGSSKYSASKYMTQNKVSSRRLFLEDNKSKIDCIQSKITELNRAKSALHNSATELQTKIDQLELECNEWKKKLNQIITAEERLKMGVDRSKKFGEMIKTMDNEYRNLTDPKIEINRKIQERLLNIKNSLKVCVELAIKYGELIVEKQAAAAKFTLWKNENKCTQDCQSAEDNVNKAKSEWDAIKLKVIELQRKYEEKKSIALQATNNMEPTSSNYLQKRNYDKLPNTIDELNAKIDDISCRIDCMGGIQSGDAIRNFQKLNQQRAELEVTLKGYAKTNLNYINQIDSISENWTKEIERIVQQLSYHFQTFMRSTNFDGDIVLSYSHEHDFDSYCLVIKVKFRPNDELEPLNEQRQSGGERAVSISTYTLAMQCLAHVPFRCVDELNQGMDDNNERILFNIVLKETSKPGKSQYFFYTPKIPEGLKLNNDQRYSVMFNSETLNSMVNFL